jgi:hypothetical protein
MANKRLHAEWRHTLLGDFRLRKYLNLGQNPNIPLREGGISL